MGKKTCPKCQKEFEDSKGQKAQRTMVVRMLKMIHVAGVDAKHEETKNDCFCCWEKDFKTMLKPYADQLGVKVNWEEAPGPA